MSQTENWKIERGEHEMKQAGDVMMKKASEKKKLAEDEKWDEIKISLYVGSKPEDESIDWIIGELRKKYQLPKKL